MTFIIESFLLHSYQTSLSGATRLHSYGLGPVFSKDWRAQCIVRLFCLEYGW